MGKEEFQIQIQLPNEGLDVPDYMANLKTVRPLPLIREKSGTKTADLLKFALLDKRVRQIIEEHYTDLFQFIFPYEWERERYAISYHGMLKYLFPDLLGMHTEFEKIHPGRGYPYISRGDLIIMPQGPARVFRMSHIMNGVDIDPIEWYGRNIGLLDPNPILWVLQFCPRFALWASQNTIEFTQKVMDAGFSRTDALLMLSSIIHRDEDFGNIVEMVSMTFKFTSDRDFSILAANQLLLKRVGFRYVEDVGVSLGIAGTKFFYGVISNFHP